MNPAEDIHEQEPLPEPQIAQPSMQPELELGRNGVTLLNELKELIEDHKLKLDIPEVVQNWLKTDKNAIHLLLKPLEAIRVHFLYAELKKRKLESDNGGDEPNRIVQFIYFRLFLTYF